MSHRPRLHRSIRVYRRVDTSVQVGAGTCDGIVLDGLTGPERDYVESLDVHSMRRHQMPPPCAGELLGLLRLHGLLDESGESAAWPTRLPRVAVDGAGGLVRALRRGLAEVGYRVVPTATPRGVAPLSIEAARPHRGRPEKLPSRRHVDLAVLVDRGGVPFLTGEPWRQAGIPHLPVVLDGPLITVGPLIDAAGPCLRCLDLVRCDRDPAWPVVLAQVAGHDATDSDDTPGTPDGMVERSLALAVAVAAIHGHVVRATRDADAHLSPDHTDSPMVGESVRSGAARVSTSWRLPGPSVTRHEWHVHPLCPAHAASETMGR